MLTRRQLLTRTGQATAAAATLGVAAPFVHARQRPVLRVLGTHVTLQPQIRERAMQDLGIDLVFERRGPGKVLQKASTRPEAFDLCFNGSNCLRLFWDARAIQPLDLDRITHWPEVSNLTKTGRATLGARLGAGDAPYRMLYAQADGSLGSTPTGRISFLPTVHNVDAFGYDTRHVPRGTAYESESWGWLLDPRFRGRVGLVNEPTIGLFDAALAARAAGLVKIANLGAMTRDELDELFEVLIERKQAGHFGGLWNSVPQSVQFMQKGRVVIQSLFAPAVAQLNAAGVPVRYAAPREGYRAWHGMMCLSSKATGHVRDAAYAYLNWWLDGWAGAFVARQGFYISTPQRSRPHLSPEEWDYWYEGSEARTELCDPDGRVAVRRGQLRSGGGYDTRLSRIAVWSTLMDTYEYSLTRWYEFLTA